MISSDVKLVAIFDNLEAQIKALRLKHGKDGARGADGISIKGEKGDRGLDGVGHKGDKGDRGYSGTDGIDGADGISIVDAAVDFDNHLVIKFSDGNEVDAGEIQGGSGGDQYFRSGSKVSITNGASSEHLLYKSETISVDKVLDDNTLYLTGSDFIIEDGITLTIPQSSELTVETWAAQRQL